MTVALEIFVEDIKYFEDILPDSWMPPGSGSRLPEVERLKRFSQTGLSFRTADGAALPVSVRAFEPRLRVDRASPNAGMIDPLTGRTVPKPPEDPRVAYAELFYGFQDQKPERLEISSPTDSDGQPVATVGMIVFDRDVAVTDFRFLSKVARLSLNWDDPWYSKFDNPNLRRHHRYPVMSYIYAEPYEIRHEAVMRVRDAALLTGTELEGDILSTGDRNAITQALPDLLNDSSPMTVNGKPVQPEFSRMSFLKVSASGLVFLEKDEAVRTDAAIVGLIFSVPTASLANSATVTWTLFTDTIQKIPAQTIDAAGPFITELTPEEPLLEWVNYFTDHNPPAIAPVVFGEERLVDVPMATLLMIPLSLAAAFVLFQLNTICRPARLVTLAALVLITGLSTRIGWVTMVNPIAGAPDETSAERITGQLVQNVYKALPERIPENLNAALSTSISSGSFVEVKQELDRALVVKMQGGGAGIVKEVQNLTVASVRQISDDGGFQTSVSWRATVHGDHWGHPHRKVILFSALMDVGPVDNAWKITGLTVTSARPEN
ncbi:hypothetical protein K3727_23055 (plasmid) [Rhodobacteraceae bacterium M382]|nr:hypothetical protein K3727_23055 [Rhodobacteraceae bacterium M382]